MTKGTGATYSDLHSMNAVSFDYQLVDEVLGIDDVPLRRPQLVMSTFPVAVHLSGHRLPVCAGLPGFIGDALQASQVVVQLRDGGLGLR
jgi:hypothetical protein